MQTQVPLIRYFEVSRTFTERQFYGTIILRIYKLKTLGTMIIIILSFAIVGVYPMSFPFVIPLMVMSMKKTFTIEEAVLTDRGVIPYKVYQHNPVGNKLKYIKCIKYKNLYLSLTPPSKLSPYSLIYINR